MLSAALFICLAGAPQRAEIDPLLPDELRPTVERAIEAELDPKRGPNNAIEILAAKRSEVAANPAEALALDLRKASVHLRMKFLAANEFEEPARYVQALSTFSRLELDEPGLPKWLDRTLDKNPEAKKKLGKKVRWTISAAFLIRGTGLDKKLVQDAWTAAFEKVGVKLESVPAQKAPVVITVGAEDAPRPAGAAAAVKVTLGLQAVENGKVAWEQTLFRVEAADGFDKAVRSALAWTAQIGGRDLFFHWLGENGLPLLKDPMPHAQRPKREP